MGKCKNCKWKIGWGKTLVAASTSKLLLKDLEICVLVRGVSKGVL